MYDSNYTPQEVLIIIVIGLIKIFFAIMLIFGIFGILFIVFGDIGSSERHAWNIWGWIARACAPITLCFAAFWAGRA